MEWPGSANARDPGAPGVTVGLYYYRLRYYDPEAGRFVSRDPLGLWGDAGQNGNGQSYCGNNPVNRVDPLGADDRDDFEKWDEEQAERRRRVFGTPTVFNPRVPFPGGDDFVDQTTIDVTPGDRTGPLGLTEDDVLDALGEGVKAGAEEAADAVAGSGEIDLTEVFLKAGQAAGQHLLKEIWDSIRKRLVAVTVEFFFEHWEWTLPCGTLLIGVATYVYTIVSLEFWDRVRLPRIRLKTTLFGELEVELSGDAEYERGKGGGQDRIDWGFEFGVGIQW